MAERYDIRANLDGVSATRLVVDDATGRYGVALQIVQNSASPERTGPLFVRDHGLMLFNPTMNKGISLGAGETWTGACGVRRRGFRSSARSRPHAIDRVSIARMSSRVSSATQFGRP